MTELRRQKRGFDHFIQQILEFLNFTLLSFFGAIVIFIKFIYFGGKIVPFKAFA